MASFKTGEKLDPLKEHFSQMVCVGIPRSTHINRLALFCLRQKTGMMPYQERWQDYFTEVKAAPQYPPLTINIETGDVQRPAWVKPRRIGSLHRWDTLLLLTRSAGQAVPERAIREVVVATNARLTHPTASTITYLRKDLADDPKHPTLLVTSGSSLLRSKYDSAYTLYAAVEVIGDPDKAEAYRQSIIQRTKNYKEVRQQVTFWLPDGQEIAIKGKQQIHLLQQVLSSQHPLGNDVLANKLYGSDDKSARDKISAIVSALNRQLEIKNWRITPAPQPERKVVYRFEEIEEDNSAWGRTRNMLRARIPGYDTAFAVYTGLLKEFWEIRQKVAQGGSSQLITEFAGKQDPEIISLLAPALKEITSIVQPPRRR